MLESLPDLVLDILAESHLDARSLSRVRRTAQSMRDLAPDAFPDERFTYALAQRDVDASRQLLQTDPRIAADHANHARYLASVAIPLARPDLLLEVVLSKTVDFASGSLLLDLLPRAPPKHWHLVAHALGDAFIAAIDDPTQTARLDEILVHLARHSLVPWWDVLHADPHSLTRVLPPLASESHAWPPSQARGWVYAQVAAQWPESAAQRFVDIFLTDENAWTDRDYLSMFTLALAVGLDDDLSRSVPPASALAGVDASVPGDSSVGGGVGYAKAMGVDRVARLMAMPMPLDMRGDLVESFFGDGDAVFAVAAVSAVPSADTRAQWAAAVLAARVLDTVADPASLALVTYIERTSDAAGVRAALALDFTDAMLCISQVEDDSTAATEVATAVVRWMAALADARGPAIRPADVCAPGLLEAAPVRVQIAYNCAEQVWAEAFDTEPLVLEPLFAAETGSNSDRDSAIVSGEEDVEEYDRPHYGKVNVQLHATTT
ncbi:hypothetical protein BC828DRAFT_380542 [Blastocladiella britannica]|nr:hypothetical protein BC828DRAFT_380542 [Blastocladiella britannica]